MGWSFPSPGHPPSWPPSPPAAWPAHAGRSRGSCRGRAANGAIVVDTIRRDNYAKGFDALSLEYVDMIGAGIVDPTKVTRCALRNAASIASLLLTTDALVSDMPEKDPEPAGAGHMH